VAEARPYGPATDVSGRSPVPVQHDWYCVRINGNQGDSALVSACLFQNPPFAGGGSASRRSAATRFRRQSFPGSLRPRPGSACPPGAHGTAGQGAVHLRATGDQQQAGGGHVQTMHGQRIGKFCLQPADQAVRLVGPPPRDREQAGRLVDDEQRIIDVKNLQPAVGRWRVRAASARLTGVSGNGHR
jgi:hypothetical protein